MEWLLRSSLSLSSGTMVVAISGPKTTELVKVEARMEPQAFGIQSLCYLKVTGNGVKLWL